MTEKRKISSIQMALLMYPTIVATAVLSVPATTGRLAKNDLWMSPIWASSIGFLTVYLAVQLHKIYPKQSFMQYSEHILGKVLGKVVGFLYLVFFLQITGSIVRLYGEFVKGVFLAFTPMIVVIGVMILVCSFAVRSGVEVVARVAQVFAPLFLLPLPTLFVFLYLDLRPENMLPILENGLIPSLRGAVQPQAWFGEVFVISFFLPFVTDENKSIKWSMISVTSVMIVLVSVNLVALFLYDLEVSVRRFPIMLAFRYISIADFIENIESIIMAVWVTGVFLKITVFYYVIVSAASQWMRLSDQRSIVLPMGFLITLFSFWAFSDVAKVEQFDIVAFPFYGTLFQTVIPGLLLIIAFFRKKKAPAKKDTDIQDNI
ncbi:GerAB/ArcD/ProY family transporter [Brevibacillus sp. SYSU BS000544]|uniref:GerAB/ArcD/ProY family transporter n=1 Tax=Brevibacillus sp. SYSU BS000544 TaxID=3416443 RepID=UPI003CE4600C